jgi:hypothetical protein
MDVLVLGLVLSEALGLIVGLITAIVNRFGSWQSSWKNVLMASVEDKNVNCVKSVCATKKLTTINLRRIRDRWGSRRVATQLLATHPGGI